MNGIRGCGIVVSAVAILIGMIYDALYMLTGQITQSPSAWFGTAMFLFGLLFLLHFISAAQLQASLAAIEDQTRSRRADGKSVYVQGSSPSTFE